MKNDSLQEFAVWFQAQPEAIRGYIAKSVGSALPKCSCCGDIESPSDRFVRWLNAFDEPKVRIGKVLTVRSLLGFFVTSFTGSPEWWENEQRILDMIEEGAEGLEPTEKARVAFAAWLEQKDDWLVCSKSWDTLCDGALSNAALGKWWALEQLDTAYASKMSGIETQ